MSSVNPASTHPLHAQLPENLLSYLQKGSLGIVITIGPDQYPTDSFAWVIGLDSHKLRFTTDHGSNTINNLQRDGRAAIQIIGPDNLVFLIKGTAKQTKKELKSAGSIKAALWEMDIIGARDQSWSGATPQTLSVQWSADQREKMSQIEAAVFNEMRL